MSSPKAQTYTPPPPEPPKVTRNTGAAPDADAMATARQYADAASRRKNRKQLTIGLNGAGGGSGLAL